LLLSSEALSSTGLILLLSPCYTHGVGRTKKKMMGAVIGKALAPLETGSGVIEVLISLQ